MDRAFVPFGASHLWVFAAVFAVSLALSAAVRLERAPLLAASIRWVLAAVLIASWGLWFALLYDKGWFSVATVLPMNLCDWATIAAVATLIRPNQRTYELAYFWALSGTLQALLTPALAVDFPDLRFIVFFALHGGVVVSALFLTLGLGMRPWPSSIPRVAAWSLLYLVAAMGVNALFGTNFGFLAEKPVEPSLLDLLAPWPYGIGELILLGGGFIVLLYAPYFVLDWRRTRRNRMPAVTAEPAAGARAGKLDKAR